MSILNTKNLKLITAVYWFLLVYVVAALVWWFISLEKQNQQMTNYKLQELKLDDVFYERKSAQILEEERRKTTQYVGEGVTFLVLILIAAVFVYRATRRQFRSSMQQQNFMMAITHELKTPIAVARLNLETLQRRKLDEQQQQRLLHVALQETNRLNTLCNNILLASQYDAGAYKLHKTEVDFSNVVRNSVKDFEDRFPKRQLTYNIEENVVIFGEELLLQLLTNNLIENALKYSDVAAPVHIALQQNEHMLELTVADNGPGIAENEKKKVFEKFYRIGNESTRNAKGTGLGLYLCSKISENHQANITIHNNKPKGSIFTVSFKR